MPAEEQKPRAAGYSFRRAHETDAFQQASLLTVDAFGREAKEREIGLSFGSTLRDQLEELDEVGALRPVLFDLGDGGLVFREEVEFAPWETYGVTLRGDFRQVNAYYSHWQLLYARDAVELGKVSVSIDWFLDEMKRQTIGPGWLEWYSRQNDHRRGLDDTWRQSILLLVRLQNRYFPVIRGTLTKITTSLVFDPRVGRTVDPYRETVREFEPQAVLDELGLTADDIREKHQRLAFQGITRDPLKHFHALFRMAPYRERAKLKNEARRAQDAFDAAEMLRRFYHDLTGELLPVADDIIDVGGGRWKEQFYGHEPRLRYDRHDLQVALRLAHLDPHIVHVIVEGDSEETLFRRLIQVLTGSDPSSLGVTFSNLEGIGRTRLYTRILRIAKSLARFPILVVDRENDIERDVRLLKDEGLLSDETTFLWDASLEEDNFTDEELVAAATRIAERKGSELHLQAGDLRTVRERQKALLGDKAKGLAELLVDLARNPDHGSVQLSKPELAEELVEFLLNEMENEDDQDALVQRRPVLGIAISVIRVA
jgi:hypothetical protein